jgi:hypothetical protein
METLNAIEKITLLISVAIVGLINLSIAMDKFKMKLNLKRFSKISLIMLFIVSSFLVKSQDTIYFKNKTTVAAKITEVGISEIKYQRLDNLTGPNYLSSKNEILLIKYSNGVTDTIKALAIVSAPVITSTPYYSNPDAIRLSGNRIIYQNRAISDKQLKSMIKELPSSETQIKMKKEFTKLNEYKLKESALAVGLFLSGTAVHGYALQAAFGGNYRIPNEKALIATFIAGAALRISGHVVNIVYRNKKKSKRQDIVDIYNGSNN